MTDPVSGVPRFVVGVVGPDTRLNCELTAAITKVLACSGLAQAMNPTELGADDPNFVRACIGYRTPHRTFTHLVCSGNPKLRFRRMTIGAMAQMHAVIIPVRSSARAPVSDFTFPRTAPALGIGVKYLSLFTDTPPSDHSGREWLTHWEQEWRNCIVQSDSRNFFSCFRGVIAAVLTCDSRDPNHPEYRPIRDLLAHLDTIYPGCTRDPAPFLMPVQDEVTPDARAFITGVVRRGRLQTGEPVEIVGLTETRQTVVTRIENGFTDREVPEAVAGEYVRVFLRGISRQEIKSGQVIAAPGSVTARHEFNATIRPFGPSYSARNLVNNCHRFSIGTADVAGDTAATGDWYRGAETLLDPSQGYPVTIHLRMPVVHEPGWPFIARSGHTILCRGTVKTPPSPLPLSRG